MKYRLTSFVMIIFVLIAAVFQPQSSAFAATTITVEPITWNVIGLDSNNVNVGPNHFPIGARVCNTGASAASTGGVTAKFCMGRWIPKPNIPISISEPGTLAIALPFQASPPQTPDTCIDFYFEVEVTRNSSAYNHIARPYHHCGH